VADKKEVVHFAIKYPYSGADSLCGDNSAQVEINGKMRMIYGGATRTTKTEKVTCPNCLKKLKEKEKVKASNEKILYGEKYTHEDFEYSVRVKGTQVRFVQKGNEWFLVNSDFRVMGIGKSREQIAALYYQQIRGRGQDGIFRLHNIQY